MANERELKVSLIVGLRKFQQGLRQATGMMRTFANRASGTLRRLGGPQPGGVGGFVSKTIQGATQLALLPTQLIAAFTKILPYVGKVFSGVLTTVLGVFQSIMEAAANLVGHVVNAFARMAERIGRIFGRIAKWGTAAFVGVTAVAVRSSTQVARAWNKVRTIIDLGPEAATVRRQLQELAITTGKSLVEVIEGYYQTVSAGFTDAGEALAFMTTALKASVGGAADFPTVVKALSRTLRNFNIDARESVRAMDAILRTVDVGQIELPELAEAIGPVANAAAAMNARLEDTLAALGILAQAGPPAIMATQLRGFFLALAKPSDQALKAMQALKKQGIDVTAEAFRRSGLVEYLRNMRTIAERMPGMVGEIFPDRRAFLGVQAMIRMLPQIEEAIGEISDSAGKTERNFRIMLDDLLAQWRRTWQAIQAVLREYGDPIAKELQQWLQMFPDELAKWRDAARKTGKVMAGWLRWVREQLTGLGREWSLENFKAAIKELPDWLSTNLPIVWLLLKSEIKGFGVWLVNWVDGLWALIKPTVLILLNNIVRLLHTALDKANEAFLKWYNAQPWATRVALGAQQYTFTKTLEAAGAGLRGLTDWTHKAYAKATAPGAAAQLSERRRAREEALDQWRRAWGVGARAQILGRRVQELAGLAAPTRRAPTEASPDTRMLIDAMERTFAGARDVDITIEGQIIDEKTLKRLTMAIHRALLLNPVLLPMIPPLR